MQVKPEQLEGHLKRGLAPVYVVSGDEPLQIEESLDLIRGAVRTAGFSERVVMDVEAGFDWDVLAANQNSMSLFSEQRLLDLRLPNGKPGDAGSKAFAAYCGAPPDPDTILLVSAGELDARARRAKWYRTLEGAGVAVHAWPIENYRLPGWIKQRARAAGHDIDDEAATELAARTEGNLLACAQEIELLGMLARGRTIKLATIQSVSADSARFDTFDLVDATLEGDAARTVRILRGLEREGAVPTLVAGTVAWEVRALAEFSAQMQGGRSLDEALGSNPVWKRRRNKLAGTLQRHSARFWREAFSVLREIDALSKGARTGNPWDELLRLCVALAGIAILPRTPRAIT